MYTVKYGNGIISEIDNKKKVPVYKKMVPVLSLILFY